MTHLDFYLFENGVSSGKFTHRPLLSSVCSCMFKKGSSKLFLEDHEYQSGEYLKEKVAASLLKGVLGPVQRGPQGISDTKKQDIIDKVCPLMPSNRSAFWKNLPIDENVPDLITHQKLRTHRDEL